MHQNIRTIRAADARSALSAVKAQVGPNAIILSTREVGGGMFSKPEVEITVSTSDAHSGNERQSPAADAIKLAPSATWPLRGYPGMPPLQHGNGTRELMDHGLAPQLAQEVSDGARTQEAVIQALAQRLHVARAPWLAGPRRVLALVGPTGHGKTTTIAKIAARAKIESARSVALVTTDAYRIGATEQIGRYGGILNVPTYVARTRNELTGALQACAAFSLVLVDSAGRSDVPALQKQVAVLNNQPELEVCLTLSAATGWMELQAASERYSGFSPRGIIFTKIDEAAGPGSIFSAPTSAQQPLLCFTDGQSVPEDLHQADAVRLVRRILGNA